MRADVLAGHDAHDIAWGLQIEDHERQFAFHEEGDGGEVHDAELFTEDLFVGDLVVEASCGVFIGVGGVDAIDLGGFEDDIGLDFGGSQRGAGVGGEEGVSGAGGEDDGAAFFEMSDGASADEGFADAVDGDGGEDSGGLAGLFHGFLECEGIDDGGEHAHVVGGGAGDGAVVGEFFAADEVTAADDDSELDAELGDFGHLLCDILEFRGVDTEAAVAAESLAADFEEDTFVLQIWHRGDYSERVVEGEEWGWGY